ncbi:MAG TPA: hypothetical protein EYP35_10570 [Desulfobacterales bacterium]|nr:hypothetical protein [Desulfobacterales bacterium]HIP40751.1 hypothetical protein [Desulfocapsa sulfexigens]
MYQSLLPILKPLVFEGKSGTLEVVHKYDDTARLYIKEGIVEQVETKSIQGKDAASSCMRWVSISATFQEGNHTNYTPDPSIDTMSLLSFLEKTFKNITIINDKIPDDNVIFQVDPEKLNNAAKLNASDYKMALLIDGQRDIAQIIAMSGQSELAVLTRICRLLLAGVAKEKEAASKEVMSSQEQNKFLTALNDELMGLVGPAGAVLVEDAFEQMDLSPEMLAKEDIGPLLSAVAELLEDEEKVALNQWSKNYS